MNELISGVALVVAILIDWRFGDLPNRLHPVVAMGNWIAWTRRQGLKSKSNAVRLTIGAASLVFGIVVIAGIAWAFERLSRESPFVVSICIQAAVLKCTFSIRSLAYAGSSVASALHSNDLPLARQQLAYHLVSRDTSQLDESSIAAQRLSRLQRIPVIRLSRRCSILQLQDCREHLSIVTLTLVMLCSDIAPPT